jgi:hypothetical protein
VAASFLVGHLPPPELPGNPTDTAAEVMAELAGARTER